MEILWISGRNLGTDLADSTEIGLIDCINKTENDVLLLSPGKKEDMGESHLSVKIINMPGLITISGSFDIKKKIKQIIQKRNFDIIIIDWRYVSLLQKTLIGINIPWFMIDRGPPAKQNWKLRFQKNMWRRSWEIAKKHAMNGIVVSSMHNEFIKKYARVEMENIVVKSGSSYANGSIKKVTSDTILEVVYIGQVDKRRDIRSLLRFKEELEKNYVQNNFTVVGKGDYFLSLKEEIKYMDRIKLHYHEGREKIGEILAGSHIGVLPMPKSPIWEIASPIKLVEYSRFGLITVGPKHSGNQWEDRQPEQRCWEFLSENVDWWVEAVEKIKQAVDQEKWGEYSEAAIIDSEDRTWDRISAEMIRDIKMSIIHG